jgi:hypothetical protein
MEFTWSEAFRTKQGVDEITEQREGQHAAGQVVEGHGICLVVQRCREAWVYAPARMKKATPARTKRRSVIVGSLS